MELKDFVKERFGQYKLEELLRIRQGGDNNSKGSKFEEFFAVVSIFRVAASEEDLGDFEISAQELAFVDDLTLRRFSTKRKINYQLKNSYQGAADWDSTITDRFRLQHILDTSFHGASQSMQLLIVPCPAKAAKNLSKIPQDLKGVAGCELFDYKSNSYELITGNADLRKDLTEMCQSNELLVLDTAFKYVLSVWSGNNERQTIADIIAEAQKLARPNIFKSPVPPVPEWLVSKVDSFQGMEISVESGHFIVSYRGLRATLGHTFEPPDAERLNSLSTAGSFMKFLMSTILAELNNDGE